jgi:hypothetical protein
MEPLIFMACGCIDNAMKRGTTHKGTMRRGLDHPSVPFLFAALAALSLYRIAETGFGFSGQDIFAFGLGGAAVMAAVLGLAHWTRMPRRG